MKKKIVKWIGAACIAMMALCIGAIPVHAEEIQQLHIEGYDLAENRMKIYLSSNADVLEDKDNLEIILGDTVYTADTVTSFANANEAVSYLVLVDVSGSVTQKDIANTKEILTNMVEMKTAADNMSIVEIRNEIVKTDFVSDNEILLEQIQTLERTGEDTNLYLAVREALKIMNEEPACHNKKCLIIISDGMDDQKNGILFEDVRDAIKENNIPICTLAMPWGGSKSEEPDKVMRSFTENAAGGIYVRYQDTELDNNLIAKSFAEFAYSGIVAEISLEGFEPNGSMVTLSVDLLNETAPTEGDSCQIPSHAISAVLVEEIIVELPEETVLEVENIESPDDNNQEELKWLYLLPLLLGIIVVAAVVIICIRKKDVDTKEDCMTDEVADVFPVSDNYMQQSESVTTAGATSNDHVYDANSETPTGDGEKECVTDNTPHYITLTEIGPMATRVLNMEFKSAITIGRKKSADFVISDDNQVSGIHCRLVMEQEQMYIEDLDSTNGTFLNGLPVTAKQQVKQEDTLHIGAYEYRISWE